MATQTQTLVRSNRPIFLNSIYTEGQEEERIACHILVDPRLAKGSVYSHHRKQPEGFRPYRYKPRKIVAQHVPTAVARNVAEETTESVIEEKVCPLFEIVDRPIEEDIATAAETFVERPPTPITVEDEGGVDVETQVGTFDLFNFDAEVRPMVRVIVQHTLLRALAEVYQEVEVENIAKHKDAFEVDRNVILSELQRLEAKNARLEEERARRNAQRKAAKQELRELNKKLSSAGFANYYAADVLLHTFDILEADGFFIDEIEDEIVQCVLPWLTSEMDTRLVMKHSLDGLEELIIAKTKERIETKKSEFQSEIADGVKNVKTSEQSALKQILIEDRAAEAIRRALDEYEKLKNPPPKEEDEAIEGGSGSGTYTD